MANVDGLVEIDELAGLAQAIEELAEILLHDVLRKAAA
jgi:hypothetical protein